MSIKIIMDAALKAFFSSPRFAVVGASSDTSKYGHKVFAWYLQHSLPVTPINPRAAEVTVSSKNYSTATSPSELDAPAETALSIITPPAVTLKVLQEARQVGIDAIWLQPGSFNDEVMAYARKEFKAAIGGMEGEPGGHDGWCVLVDGEEGLDLAERKWKLQRL